MRAAAQGQHAEFSILPAAMSVSESCALNPDGTLKAANEIDWSYSPTQESVQLPGTQSNGHGPTIHMFTVNAQPSSHNPSEQPPFQSVIGKNPRKVKQGRAGGEAKVKRLAKRPAKKTANEGHGIQRVLVNGPPQSGVFPFETRLE